MYLEDIKKATKENTNFRKALHTGSYSQIVAMSIPAGSDIGEETHDNVDQIIFIIGGNGQAIIGGEVRNIDEHDVVFVPAGKMHNFKNSGDKELKLFTVYSPPEHPDGTIHRTKEDAIKDEH